MHHGYDLYTVPGIWDAREQLAEQHVHYLDCRETKYIAANSLHNPAIPGHVEGVGVQYRTAEEARACDGLWRHAYSIGDGLSLHLYGRWLEPNAGEPWETAQRWFDTLGISPALQRTRDTWGRLWRPVKGRTKGVWLWFVAPTVTIDGLAMPLVRFLDAVPDDVCEKNPAAHWGKLELIVTYACGEQA